jgi:HAMP domain-containing protein
VGALATLGAVLSVTAFLVAIVVGLIVARLRRTVRKSSELEELRDMHLAAMGYIFRIEMALQEAANRAGVTVDWDSLDKPEILDRKFLAKKAKEEGNREIQDLVSTVNAMQEQLKGLIPQFPMKEKP